MTDGSDEFAFQVVLPRAVAGENNSKPPMLKHLLEITIFQCLKSADPLVDEAIRKKWVPEFISVLDW